MSSNECVKLGTFCLFVFIQERLNHRPHLIDVPVRCQRVGCRVASQLVVASWQDVMDGIRLAPLLQKSHLLQLMGYLFVGKAKNATAEVDYILPYNMQVLPLEVKAGVQGGMKSLWDFMREKELYQAVRCSLENFGEFDYIDEKDERNKNAIRHVRILPLYAINTIKL